MYGRDSLHSTVRTSQDWRQRPEQPPGLVHATSTNQALVCCVLLCVRALVNCGTLALLARLNSTLPVSCEAEQNVR